MLNFSLITFEYCSLYNGAMEEESSQMWLPQFCTLFWYWAILYLIVKTICRLKAALWGKNVHQVMKICFLGILKKRYIYLLVQKKSKLCLWYIDIFLIWTGTWEELKRFQQEFSSLHPSVKFYFFYSEK